MTDSRHPYSAFGDMGLRSPPRGPATAPTEPEGAPMRSLLFDGFSGSSAAAVGSGSPVPMSPVHSPPHYGGASSPLSPPYTVGYAPGFRSPPSSSSRPTATGFSMFSASRPPVSAPVGPPTTSLYDFAAVPSPVVVAPPSTPFFSPKPQQQTQQQFIPSALPQQQQQRYADDSCWVTVFGFPPGREQEAVSAVCLVAQTPFPAIEYASGQNWLNALFDCPASATLALSANGKFGPHGFIGVLRGRTSPPFSAPQQPQQQPTPAPLSQQQQIPRQVIDPLRPLGSVSVASSSSETTMQPQSGWWSSISRFIGW